MTEHDTEVKELEQWEGTCSRCGAEDVTCTSYQPTERHKLLATCRSCKESLREKTRYRCLVCHDYTSAADGRRGALSALGNHVSKMHSDLGWDGYLLKHELHPCETCGRPLDMLKLDECYDCRVGVQT